MTKNYLLVIAICALLLLGLAPEPKSIEAIFLRLFFLVGFVSGCYVALRYFFLKHYAKRLKSAFTRNENRENKQATATFWRKNKHEIIKAN